MPTFNSFVKQVEINSGGGVRITVLKQTIFDDGIVHDHPHQITIDTLADQAAIDEQIAGNNKHLNEMGYPSIDPAELDWPMQLRAKAHTLPLVQERQDVERELRKKVKDEAEAQERAARKAAEDAETARKAVIQDAIDAAVASAVKASKGK